MVASTMQVAEVSARRQSRRQNALDHRNHRPAQDDDCRRPGHGAASLASGSLSCCNKLALTSACLAIVLLLVLSLAVAQTRAYPSGAPESACKDLKPGHGAEPQSGASPFELSQDKLQVGAGDQIKVTLSSSSGTTFKGLIVQANNEAGEPKGKFLPGTGLKTLDSCSAVTHSDKEAKKTATLVWQAPDDLKAKEAFVFKATVVKKFDEIYMNIKSSLKSS